MVGTVIVYRVPFVVAAFFIPFGVFSVIKLNISGQLIILILCIRIVYKPRQLLGRGNFIRVAFCAAAAFVAIRRDTRPYAVFPDFRALKHAQIRGFVIRGFPYARVIEFGHCIKRVCTGNRFKGYNYRLCLGTRIVFAACDRVDIDDVVRVPQINRRGGIKVFRKHIVAPVHSVKRAAVSARNGACKVSVFNLYFAYRRAYYSACSRCGYAYGLIGIAALYSRSLRRRLVRAAVKQITYKRTRSASARQLNR